MIINYKFFVLVLILFIIFSCEKNPAISSFGLNLSKLEGTTIIYNLIGEEFCKNRIMSENKDRELSDNKSYWSLRLNTTNNRIAYIKNSEFLIYYGIDNEENSTVCISNFNGKDEKELLSQENSNYYYIEWINEEKLALSINENDNYSIVIIDINGEIDFKIETNSIYQLYMLPDGINLIAYNYSQILIIDVITGKEKVFYEAEDEIAAFILPFYSNGSVIFDLFNNEYLKIDLNDYSQEIFSLENHADKLAYQNDKYKIYYNYNENSNFKLFQDSILINSVNIPDYDFDGGIYLSDDKIFYFVGEIGDDEGCIIKVNFKNGNITKLTNHNEDNFISDSRYYNLF